MPHAEVVSQTPRRTLFEAIPHAINQSVEKNLKKLWNILINTIILQRKKNTYYALRRGRLPNTSACFL
jgi:hypothetical protein